MTIDKALDTFFAQYDSYTDQIIGLSFVREPFAEDFMKWAGLPDEAAFVKAFDAFVLVAHKTFRWNDYLEARMTAEQAFRDFYAQQHYPETNLEEALNGFIVSFFNQVIDERQYAWEDAHPDEEMPKPLEDDIDNLYLARVFSILPNKKENEPISEVIAHRKEEEEFCEGLSFQYHYEQLHMCCWFSGQITNGAGQYSRDKVNYSARTTYNRLLNPYSLLWIGVVMGADREKLKAAAEEMATKKTPAAKCGIVRKYVPFDDILELFNGLMTEEDAE